VPQGGAGSPPAETSHRSGARRPIPDRPFRIDREPDGRSLIVLSRQADCELHPFVAPRACCHILCVLFAGEDLVQEISELHFAECPPRPDVGQNLFQVTHAAGQAFHLSKSFTDLFEAFTDPLEGIPQPLFQCGMQFFVHRFAHLFQPEAVFILKGSQAFLDRGPHPLQFFLAGLRQCLE
jgi:hypothetical protein